MALSAPTLTAPPGFALRWLRRASPKGACPPPLILGAGGGVPHAKGWRKRTSFRCTFRHGGRGTGACIPAAAPRKRTGFLLTPVRKNPARFPDGRTGPRKRRTPFPPPAAPAGITHYTLQARSCAKGGRAPLWNPPASGLRAKAKAPPPLSIHPSINPSYDS